MEQRHKNPLIAEYVDTFIPLKAPDKKVSVVGTDSAGTGRGRIQAGKRR